jgi:hypothetical protein
MRNIGSTATAETGPVKDALPGDFRVPERRALLRVAVRIDERCRTRHRQPALTSK